MKNTIKILITFFFFFFHKFFLNRLLINTLKAFVRISLNINKIFSSTKDVCTDLQTRLNSLLVLIVLNGSHWKTKKHRLNSYK